MTDQILFDPHIHHRRSIRLAGYDYAQAGAYFLTICATHHKNIFGTIIAGKMEMNACGRIVRDEWLKSAEIRWEIELDVFIVIPDHLHGIVIIHDIRRDRGDRPVAPTIPVAPTEADAIHFPMGPKQKSVASFMAGFKSATAKRINEIRNTTGTPVWQRNYYEHIIRDENDLQRIREYILHNPDKWPTENNGH